MANATKTAEQLRIYLVFKLTGSIALFGIGIGFCQRVTKNQHFVYDVAKKGNLKTKRPIILKTQSSL